MVPLTIPTITSPKSSPTINWLSSSLQFTSPFITSLSFLTNATNSPSYAVEFSLVPRILAYKESQVGFDQRKEVMTIKPAVRITERKLVVKDRTILTNVPDNVIATSGLTSGPVGGVFLGADFDQDKSRHVVSLGTLRNVRFMACFRFKLWWMAQKMGDKGREIPLETRFLLVETEVGSHLEPENGGDDDNKIVYTVFLPLVEGPFRAVLQGNSQDELDVFVKWG